MEEFELEPGEHTICTVRQHVFVLVLRLLPFLLLAFLPTIIGIFFAFIRGTSPELSQNLTLFAQYSGIGNFLNGVWLLFLWMGAFSTFLRFYLTMWIVTNIRILDIRQYGFFRREVSSFLLIRVQDITTEIYGIIPTLIGYGHLHVETAGNDEKFSMNGVAHPQHLRDLILNQVALLHDSPTTSAKDGL